MGRRKKLQPYIIENLEITDTTTTGKGVARHGEQVIFVEKAVPGDIVDARVFRKEKKVPLASIERIVQPSSYRVDPICDHFGSCGGCKWQNLSYDRQLFFKEKQVTDALERIGHLEIEESFPILRVASDYNYRNKVEFTFSNKRWVPAEELENNEEVDRSGAFGYHVARFFDKIIDIEECHLPRKDVNDIRNEVRVFSKAQGYEYYDIREHTGYLRGMVFRSSEGTKELMVILMVAKDDQEPVDAIFTHLESKFPQITSFIWIHNHKLNSSYGDLEAKVWKGPPHITEVLGPWKYRISPTSFFQTNSLQAKVLYDQVRGFIGDKTGIIYDLYCGAGSIGIYVSDLADKIVGIEYSEASIQDAWKNLKLNDLSHFSFHAGDMKKILTEELCELEGKPDVIVTDPPRAGMDPAVVTQLLKLRAPKIVYVSCNPATQARDIAVLSEIYHVRKIQPVDMFPQTSHVENVALLELKD